MIIVITGNPVDGFGYFGPFDDVEAADAWAERQRFEESYWVHTLETPS